MNATRHKVLRAIGFDPGLSNTGWGVVEHVKGKFKCVGYGVIKSKPGRFNPTPPDALGRIYRQARDLVLEYEPCLISIESVFFGKNVKTAMGTAHVIGALSIIPHAEDVPAVVVRPTPPQVKASVGLTQSSPKKQVQLITQRILRLDKPITPHHAADALACAIFGLLHPIIEKEDSES